MVNTIIKEGSIEMANKLDKDDEMEIEIDNGAFQYAWINREQALKIIKHLETVFEISTTCLL